MAIPPRLWTKPREQGGQLVKEDEDLVQVPSAATGVYGTQVTNPSAEFNSYQGTVNPRAKFLGGEEGFSADEFRRMQAIGADAGRNIGNIAVQQATAGGAAAGTIADVSMGARNEAAAIGDRVSQNAALRAAGVQQGGAQVGQGVADYTQRAGQTLAGTGATIGQGLTQTGQRVGGELAGTGAGIRGDLSRTGQRLEAGIRDTTAAEAAALRAAGTRYGQGVSADASAGADRLVNTGAAQGAGVAGYGQGAAADISAIGQAGAQDIRGVGRAGQTALVGMGQGATTQGGASERTALMTAGKLAGLEATEGPSAAQATLRSGLSKAQADALSTARSGSGWGDSSSALRAGLREQSRLGTETMNESARLRAAENAAWRARQAQNLGTAGGLQSEVGLAQSARGLRATETGYGLGMTGAQSAGELGATSATAAGELGLRGTTAGAELTTQARREAEALRQAGSQAGAELGTMTATEAARLNAAAAMGAGNLRAGLESTGAGIGAGTATAGAGIESTAATNAANIGAQTATTGTQIGAAGTTAGAGITENALLRAAELGQAGDIAGGQFTMGGEQMGVSGLTSAAGVEQGALANAAQTRGAETAAVLGAEQAGVDLLARQAALEMAYNEEMRRRYEGKRGLDLEGERTDQGWLSAIAGGISSGAGGLAALFSDVRLKEDVRPADRALLEAARSPGYWEDRARREQSEAELLRAAQTPEYWEERERAEAVEPPSIERGDYGHGVWTSGPKKGQVVLGRPTPRPPPPTVEQAAEASGLPYGVWRSGPKKGQVEYGEVTPREPPPEPLDPRTEAEKLRAAADAIEEQSWFDRARRRVNEVGEEVGTKAREVGEDALRGARRLDEAFSRGVYRTGQSIKNLFGGDEQAALETTRTAPAYSWQYTDPAMGQGRFYGPMAQDLEMTPAGRSAVIETPQGKAIDGGRLAALSFATNSAQQREIDELRQEVARLRATA